MNTTTLYRDQVYAKNEAVTEQDARFIRWEAERLLREVLDAKPKGRQAQHPLARAS